MAIEQVTGFRSESGKIFDSWKLAYYDSIQHTFEELKNDGQILNSWDPYELAHLLSMPKVKTQLMRLYAMKEPKEIESKTKITFEEYQDFCHRFIVKEEWPDLRFGQAFWNYYGAGVDGRRSHPELFHASDMVAAERIIMKEYVQS